MTVLTETIVLTDLPKIGEGVMPPPASLHSCILCCASIYNLYIKTRHACFIEVWSPTLLASICLRKLWRANDKNSNCHKSLSGKGPNMWKNWRVPPSITDGVHRNENFVEIIPVFSTFSNFFKKRKKKLIKAILCNFSMRLLKYF